MLTEFAPAKVNLFLHVIGRREDGYHLLDSMAVFPALSDEVSAEPAAAFSLRVRGPFGAGLYEEPGNLVLRAAQLLDPDGGAALVLLKNLPIASGIGGGSADAAATFRVLAKLWGMTAAPERVLELAARLGADVPVCLASVPARMGGVGEVLRAAPVMPDFGIVLVNPRVALATAKVFRALEAPFSQPAVRPTAWPDAAAMARDLAELRNDLEAPAMALAPAIGEVLTALRALPGVLLARMSGSGATCFALFANAAAAAAAAAALRQPVGEPGPRPRWRLGGREEWWCWGGGLYETGSADL